VVSDWGLGVPNMNLKQGLHGTPQVAFQNFTTLWSYADTGWDQITMDLVDNLTWSTGKHVIKTGFTYRHYKVDESSGDATDIFGAVDFRSFGTQSPAGDGGFDYASSCLESRIPAARTIDRRISQLDTARWQPTSRTTGAFLPN